VLWCADHRCNVAPPDRISSGAQCEGALGHLPQDLPPLHVHLLSALCGQSSQTLLCLSCLASLYGPVCNMHVDACMLTSSKHHLYAVCELLVLPNECFLICSSLLFRLFAVGVVYKALCLIAVPGLITASIASRLSISSLAPATSWTRLFSRNLLGIEMPDTSFHLFSRCKVFA